jgi:hypothetical protein
MMGAFANNFMLGGTGGDVVRAVTYCCTSTAIGRAA